MENGIQTEKNSKKKLIVPVVALMLCAVAVIGTGYAITSSVEVDDNKITAAPYSLDIYNDAAAQDPISNVFFASTGSMITLTSQKVVNAAGTSVAVTVVDNGSSVDKYVKLTSKAGDSTAYNLKGTLTVNDPDGVGLIKQVKVTIGSGQYTLTINGNEVDLGKITANAATQKMTIAVEYNELSNVDDMDDFETLKESVNKITFNVLFTASSA